MIRPFRKLRFASLSLLSLFYLQKGNAADHKVAGAANEVSSGRSPASKEKLSSPNSKSDEQWVPPDVDEVVPPVNDPACSLPDILSRVGDRVQELMHNFERFSATEVIQHRKVSRSGRLRRPEIDNFNYLAFVKHSDNFVDVEEEREGNTSSDQFPDHVETKGVTSLILIFHPLYVQGFNMKCEGLGEWQGQPAWQVHFEETLGHYMCAIVLQERSYGVRIRGRAWILASSFQVARLETDLVDTIPQIRLRLQHEAIEYRPVHFSHANIELWLPSSAELYMDFVGHRFYRRHSFTNFRLFDVTVQQFFGPPKLATTPEKKY
jgi:hypothetical protein